MIPREIVNATHTFPPHVDDDGTPIKIGPFSILAEGNIYRSVWTPTEDEIDMMAAGGNVILSVVRNQSVVEDHPIVVLEVAMCNTHRRMGLRDLVADPADAPWLRGDR